MFVNFFIELKQRKISTFLKKIIVISCYLISHESFGWGYCGHREINRYAVFTLPQPLFIFYKFYLGYITEHSSDPDKRRPINFSEREKHFIDLDFYIKNKDCSYQDVVENFLNDNDRKHGNSPMNIIKVKFDLTKAFRDLDVYKIVKLSTDLGHYIGDLNVPLHTTSNYDGQKKDQQGVHVLWESRLPELFKKNYNYFVGNASYVEDPITTVWETVFTTYKNVHFLLKAERQTALEVKIGTHSYENKKYVYSRSYAEIYNRKLKGQVERQLLKSIKMVGDFWLTCWMDAGSPDLSVFVTQKKKKLDVGTVINEEMEDEEEYNEDKNYEIVDLEQSEGCADPYEIR